MEDIVNILSSTQSWLRWMNVFPGVLGIFSLPSTTFSVAVVFSGAGLAILNRFTGNVGYVTLPINYLALLFGSLLANWYLRDLRTPFEPTLQAPIIFAMVGMTISGLIMMLVLRRQ